MTIVIAVPSSNLGRLLALSSALALSPLALAQTPGPMTQQQQINAANQISNGNTAIHDIAWFLSQIMPTAATTDAVDAAAAANTRHANRSVSNVMGQNLTAGQVAAAGDAGAVVVGMLGHSSSPQSIVGNAELRNALIENANNPNAIQLPGAPPVRVPSRPPGIYNTSGQLVIPGTQVINGQTVVMVGPDGQLTDAGLRVLQQSNAGAELQMQQYQANREQILAQLRAQNAARDAQGTASNAAAGPVVEPLTLSSENPPGYPLARPRRPRQTASAVDFSNAGAEIGAAMAAAFEAADFEPSAGHEPWDEYAGELWSADLEAALLGALLGVANLGLGEELAAALDTGCPGAPCGLADPFARGPYDQTQLPELRSGPLPMFAIGDVPSGTTMAVAELLPIYAGYDPYASGTVMQSFDLFPPGPSTVGWSLDLYPPTGISLAGNWIDLYPPTGVSSVGWSLNLYPPTGISLAGSVLWSSLTGNSVFGSGSLAGPYDPLFGSAWNGGGTGSLSDFERQRILAGLLDNPNRVSGGALHVGNLTGMSEEAMLRHAVADRGGLRALLAQPFNVLLTWGTGAYDLDLHMTGPGGAGERFHIYYAARGSLTELPFAELIRDCVCTNGSEVVLTTTLQQGGVYRVSVFNFGDQSATSTQLGSAAANVQLSIVRGGTAVGVGQGTTIEGGAVLFAGTPGTGQGNTWRAVEIDPANGRMYFVDQIVQSQGSANVQ